MTASMRHRGPDDDGLEVIPNRRGLLALGARRLAILDRSPAGHQPMHDAETGNWMVFNGEIYNFRELRSELEREGARFTSRTDTEVLLRACGRWGVKESIRRARGMFAFALWQAREQNLVLARDPLGVKPLYYVRSSSGLLFASEVRALLSSGLLSRRLSHQGLVSYLALGAVQEPLTIAEGVLALLPGHYLTSDGQELRARRYWSLADCYRTDHPNTLERPEAVQAVRDALTRSIRLRLTSDAPIGVFLSGGLDSSAITALAAGQSGSGLRTVSVVFPDDAYSEASYIARLRHRYPTVHAQRCLSEEDLAVLLPHGLAAMDQPTFDGLNTYVIAHEARRTGLSVALSGLGADELFGGYPSFRRAPRLRLMRRLIPSLLRRPVAEAVRVAGRESDQARKLSHWVSVDTAAGEGPETVLRELFGGCDRKRLAARAGAADNGAILAERLGGDDLFNSVSYFEISHYLRNVLLRDTDSMSMAHGVEVREPFLDQDLVELVAGLPGRVKRSASSPKRLLVDAVHDDLPPAILTRRKMGFSLPFDRWLRGPLGSSMEETLLDRRLGGQVADALDARAISGVVDRFRARRGSWVRVWSLYALKQWGERYLSQS